MLAPWVFLWAHSGPTLSLRDNSGELRTGRAVAPDLWNAEWRLAVSY